MFREMLCYKLARQGKAFIQVDRYLPTTRSCSACGLTRDALPCAGLQAKWLGLSRVRRGS